MNNIDKIKKQIKEECRENNFLWFYKTHLSAVEKNAKILLEKVSKADRDLVLLSVWLHDLQRIRKIEGNHAKVGAGEAKKVLEKYKYKEEIIKKVQEIILCHSCNSKLMPKTIEAKILATADAMSHYSNDFYLKIAVMGERDIDSYKEWLNEKLDRNYNVKMYFPFAKKIVKKKHEAFKEILK